MFSFQPGDVIRTFLLDPAVLFHIRSNNHQFILIKRDILAVLLLQHSPRKPHIRHTVYNLSHYLGTVRLLDLELLLRVLFIETHQHLGKQVLCRDRRCRYCNAMLAAVLLHPEMLFNLPLQIYHLLGIFI